MTEDDAVSTYDWVEAEILSGRLAPGSRVDVDVLAARRAVTVSELREAAIRLANDGLVSLEDLGSLRISPVSLNDLKDLTATRIIIETEALRRSLGAADSAWEARVRAAFETLSAVEPLMAEHPSVHLDEWERCNGAFHAALVSSCPLRRLMQINQRLYKQHQRYRQLSLMHRTTPRDVHAEHLSLFEAALARDGDAAARVLEVHIASTFDQLAKGIRDGSWFGTPML